MCVITAVFNKGGLSSAYLREANQVIAHRGPDDEGYLLWRQGRSIQIFAGPDTAQQTRSVFQYTDLPDHETDWQVGIGHRRLSIIDLSPGGHQPMPYREAGLVIAFNGEVYNCGIQVQSVDNAVTWSEKNYVNTTMELKKFNELIPERLMVSYQFALSIEKLLTEYNRGVFLKK